MSIWGFIAFQTMTAVLGTEHCQMHGREALFPQITAIAMSSDGNATFAKTTIADFAARSHQVFIGRGDKFESWTVNTPELSIWKFVDDTGRIYGNTSVRFKRPYLSAMVGRGLMFQEGNLLVIPDADEFVGSFHILGVGKDEVFGQVIEAGVPDSKVEETSFRAIVWWRGALQVLWRSDFFSHAIARSGNGAVGMVSNKKNLTPTAVLFENGGVTPLPLPGRLRTVEVVAASRNGSVITGIGQPGSSSSGACVIWVDRVPRTISLGRNQMSDARLVAVSEEGSMAVGSVGEGRGSVACIWEDEKGLRSLVEVARERKIVLPFGWKFLNAVGVGPRGEKVYGTAMDWRGRTRPYLLKLADSRRTEGK